MTLRVLKGHGTENDFVILPDLDGQYELSPQLVRALCDRHRGIGADGVLRVVRAEHSGQPVDGAAWFMDYRNADGSVAEMCGNGIRVFLRYLSAVGLVDKCAAVATRGGTLRAWLTDDGDICVDLGQPRVLADRPVVTAAPCVERVPGVEIEMPNPHVVVAVSSRNELLQLDLSTAPTVWPGRPDGQNIEFVATVADHQLAMRVHERGVGETRSCGTGIAAAVVAQGQPDGSSWRVDVPGGSAMVSWRADGGVLLTGPAVIVGEMELDGRWLAAATASQ